MRTYPFLCGVGECGIWTRHVWYNPTLDPRTIATKMTKEMAAACEAGTYNDGTSKGGGPLNVADESHPYNLVSSLCTDGSHRPAIDVDVDGGVAADWLMQELNTPVTLVGSSTPGHAHLYAAKGFATLDDYMALLDQMAGFGWVEEKYILASRTRGQTLLRPPHITKPPSNPITQEQDPR